MQCENCETKLLSTDYAVINNNYYCLNCLSTKQSLFNNKNSSSNHQVERSSNHKISTKQCQVCFDNKPEQDFNIKYSSRCHHTERTICDDCLYQHVKQAFNKMCTDNVHCPELCCGIFFKYQAVQKILSNHKDRRLLEKYERFILHRQLEKMQEFIWCAHGCGMGQLNEGGHRNNIVTCVKCYKKTCFTHKTEWHEGLTCSEYDTVKNPELQASQRWIVQNCKKCPKCSCRIEKADGCDHMTCGKCRYEFCWSCLADYNAIRRDGNHRHDSSCKHYAPYHS
ncbi:unnamed protein product [Rotaria sp. Silwood1]|nr:unnamed protein product [Rotaria sp. Silwood1]CAF3473118.1 unnamed protein product [Rotaria sp. Silwood1]CAF3480048.1 unnamed protein product [Rotaria sp. Silwood1]CAF4842213.1 unnamed protein product [Rotaria sp. Silwood1]CAF4849751.1 unnamed protein product [Rotaria sp. Silwood1]